MILQISGTSLTLSNAFGTILHCDDQTPLLYVGRGETVYRFTSL